MQYAGHAAIIYSRVWGTYRTSRNAENAERTRKKGLTNHIVPINTTISRIPTCLRGTPPYLVAHFPHKYSYININYLSFVLFFSSHPLSLFYLLSSLYYLMFLFPKIPKVFFISPNINSRKIQLPKSIQPFNLILVLLFGSSVWIMFDLPYPKCFALSKGCRWSGRSVSPQHTPHPPSPKNQNPTIR